MSIMALRQDDDDVLFLCHLVSKLEIENDRYRNREPAAIMNTCDLEAALASDQPLKNTPPPTEGYD
jgi:hypothetical protein